MMILSVSNIHKTFGETRALRGVTFTVNRREIVAVLGPSGCGKSTLLAVIAGLEEPEQGKILWKGETLQGVRPHRRGFGLMFQDYALFPHKDVRQNVAFGLEMSKWPREEIDPRVEEVLALVGLPNFRSREVGTLSGGEQQRVALARAIAPNPQLLMLDEPLGSLDRTLRERLMVELREILQKMDQTALYVTHDQEEAFAVADRVVVMKAGRVMQVGAPEEIYRKPACPFVAHFLGLNNIFRGIVEGETVRTPIGRLPVTNEISGEVTLLIRPDTVRLGAERQHQFSGTVTARSFRGSRCQLEVQVNNQQLRFEFPYPKSDLPQEGDSILLSYDPEDTIQILTDDRA